MIEKADFGSGLDGAPAYLFTLTGPKGLVVRVTNFGGIITHLFAPDRLGRLSDVALGFDSLGSYVAGHPYMGAIVGRVAGHLTSWARSRSIRQDIPACAEPVTATTPPWRPRGPRPQDLGALRRPHPWPRGAPAALPQPLTRRGGLSRLQLWMIFMVTYCVTEFNALEIEYEAVTDRATPLSLADHSYFNLGGESLRDMSGPTSCRCLRRRVCPRRRGPVAHGRAPPRRGHPERLPHTRRDRPADRRLEPRSRGPLPAEARPGDPGPGGPGVPPGLRADARGARHRALHPVLHGLGASTPAPPPWKGREALP